MIDKDQLTKWADACLRINHLNTLLQRELPDGSMERVRDLSERARVAAWTMFNELIAAGGSKPEGYCEPDPVP